MNNNDSNILNQVFSRLTAQEKYKIIHQLRTVKEINANVVGNENGYDVRTYYNTLSKKMVPTMKKLLSQVGKEIQIIGERGRVTEQHQVGITDRTTGTTIRRIEDEIVQSCEGYKEIENFLATNSNIIINSSSAELSHVVLSNNMLKTISKNNADIINLYNLRQRKYNKDAIIEARKIMAEGLENSKKYKVNKFTIPAKTAIAKK